jgi:hypothetical protein
VVEVPLRALRRQAPQHRGQHDGFALDLHRLQQLDVRPHDRERLVELALEQPEARLLRLLSHDPRGAGGQPAERGADRVVDPLALEGADRRLPHPRLRLVDAPLLRLLGIEVERHPVVELDRRRPRHGVRGEKDVEPLPRPAQGGDQGPRRLGGLEGGQRGFDSPRIGGADGRVEPRILSQEGEDEDDHGSPRVSPNLTPAAAGR